MPPDLFSKCARVQALLDRSPTLHSSRSCWERPDPVHLPKTWVPVPISSRGHPEVAPASLAAEEGRRILLLVCWRGYYLGETLLEPERTAVYRIKTNLDASD
ncbi:uncharacterized protein ARMOST_00113 [Armillaria ostoyae]|uniref:Uncharacterized protein n=1 Tax=Armillaria ostoyae TaxID=47428 RepID=A0A284QK74_ARMOS|nr:uncharacterized protein ARMOST_00113 [Armillaria ostoyae]